MGEYLRVRNDIDERHTNAKTQHVLTVKSKGTVRAKQ